jgi:2-amino-4-hydroxy-6-hydroxymethyldihydropteridine diphosphokinase
VARVYVSLGSNIERERNIRAAVRALRERFGNLVLSPVYESRPIGFEGENFYNLVAGVDTDETPDAVVAALHAIEQRLGRRRGATRHMSRTIDLDLLLHGDLVRDDPGLRLPRGEILEYACVLRPLADLAPCDLHPVIGKSFASLWAHFDQDAQPISRVSLEFPD